MKRKTRFKPGGKYVIDVTWEDLDGSVPNDPGHCAIARAVKNRFTNVTHIKVGHGTIAFTYPDENDEKQRATIRTSLKAQDAQNRLDKGLPVRPEDFPPIRLFMDEAVIKPSAFTETTRLQQNEYRKEVRDGIRKPVRMSEKEKVKRRLGRRHA
jgi:hypothetical protein